MPNCYVIIETNPDEGSVLSDVKRCAEANPETEAARGMRDRVYFEKDSNIAHAFALNVDIDAFVKCLKDEGHTVGDPREIKDLSQQSDETAD